MENALFISPRPLVAAGNDYLLEKISCHPQRTQFLVHLVIAAHVERTLQIDTPKARIDDKVNFT